MDDAPGDGAGSICNVVMGKQESLEYVMNTGVALYRSLVTIFIMFRFVLFLNGKR